MSAPLGANAHDNPHLQRRGALEPPAVLGATERAPVSGKAGRSATEGLSLPAPVNLTASREYRN